MTGRGTKTNILYAEILGGNAENYVDYQAENTLDYVRFLTAILILKPFQYAPNISETKELQCPVKFFNRSKLIKTSCQPTLTYP